MYASETRSKVLQKDLAYFGMCVLTHGEYETY